jgi:hypothetical protein
VGIKAECKTKETAGSSRQPFLILAKKPAFVGWWFSEKYRSGGEVEHLSLLVFISFLLAASPFSVLSFSRYILFLSTCPPFCHFVLFVQFCFMLLAFFSLNLIRLVISSFFYILISILLMLSYFLFVLHLIILLAVHHSVSV